MVGWPARHSPLILKMHLVLPFCSVNVTFNFHTKFSCSNYEFWSVCTQTSRPNIGLQVVVRKLYRSDMYITFIFPEV